jgi:hypothetical protein
LQAGIQLGNGIQSEYSLLNHAFAEMDSSLLLFVKLKICHEITALRSQ